MTKNGIAVGAAPHVFEVRTSSRSMWIMAACLCAPILQSSVTDGFFSLLIAVSAVSAAIAAETILVCLRDSTRFIHSLVLTVTDGSVVVTALVLALMMPNGMHPLFAVFGSVFAILVVKHSFGGLGANWLNPAAGSWLFLRFTWSPLFDSALAQSPLSLLSTTIAKGVSDLSGSPLAVLKIAGWKPSPADERVTSWLNETFLSGLGAELPTGYIDLFSSPFAGLIVDRGLFALVCATIVLLASNLVRWYLPLAFVASYLAASRVWGGLPFGGALFTGDMLYALFSGSLALAVYVLIVDPGTGCKTRIGSVITAATAGLSAFALRYFGGDAYGALLAVPAVNLIVPLFRIAERRIYFTPRVCK